MSRYIDAEKLKAEIEKFLAKAKNDEEKAFAKKDAAGHLSAVTKTAICVKIKKLIVTLQLEQPDKYETALEKAREWMPNVNQGGHFILIDIFPELGEGLDPRYGGRKQEHSEVDLGKEVKRWKNKHGIVGMDDVWLNFARNFYELARQKYEK